jgi:two-component system, OmpR family, phosphate regulon sensor histidine kinase PhoR
MLGWRTMIGSAVALAIAAVIAGLFSSAAAAWWMVLSIVAISAYHALFIQRLYFWAALPSKRELPLGSGSWASLLDRMSRVMRQEVDARHELAAELERIKAAVDRLPDGLVLLDRFDHVEWCNKAAEDLHAIFGRKRPIHHFVRQPEFIAYLERGDYTEVLKLVLPSRPIRLFEIRLHKTVDGQKLMITRDVTDQAKLDSVRRDFVANVSHEIRTPVTVIGGFAETLLNLELPAAQQREYLETILKQSQNMQRLVEDLLMLSSLENSSTLADEEAINIGALLNTLATEGQAISLGRHDFQVESSSDCRVLGAVNEIESAIRNLLTNAIRYTPQGGKITLSWSLRGDEGWIAVTDQGIGIATEHIPRLTERFYRVERGRSRETGGTGLGLAIVKHVSQRHQFRLDIQSEVGRGSCFALVVPLARVLPPA